MKEVSLDLLPGHCRRLADGNSVTVKHGMIGKGIKVNVHPTTHSKIMRAQRLGKGVRITLTPEEVEMSEGGKLSWKGFKRDFKKGWDFYKSKIKPIIGPLIKKGLQMAVEKGLPKLAARAGLPELMEFQPELEAAVEKGSEVSGAYGLRYAKGGAARSRRMRQRYHTSVTDPRLPASRPLVDVGNLQYGAEFIRGLGYGLAYASGMV
tara:strand:+ start:1110 stop:1730 length:621 start_codon:yes stop_codon:yes gene_type:complete